MQQPTFDTFIPILKELPQTRKQFAEWLTPDGVRAFAGLPIFAQVGFILAFLEKQNIGVHAYRDRYDVFVIDATLLSDQNLQGMVTLDLLNEIDDTFYIHYGWMERGQVTTVYTNLIMGLIEALKYNESYGF